LECHINMLTFNTFVLLSAGNRQWKFEHQLQHFETDDQFYSWSPDNQMSKDHNFNSDWVWNVQHSCNLECWNIHSQDYLFPGTFVPMMELSFSGLFIPWNIRFLDRSFPGTFPGPIVPGNFCSWERINLQTLPSVDRSFPVTFVPGIWTFPAADHSFVCQYLVHLQRRNSVTNWSVGLWQRPRTAAIHKQ